MKAVLYIILFVSLGCNSKINHADSTTSKDSATTLNSKDTIDISKYYTSQDTVLITTEIGDTLKYSKQEYNEIVDNHSELMNMKYVENPDELYYCKGDRDGFGSEAGQDEYYMLYAYFVKQKNGVEKYAARRKQLIDIFSNINALFQHFQYGGTYFGHQQARILAYAEFSVHLFIANENNVEKTYDITKEKELYMQSLRQIIKDESSIDFNVMGKEKLERTKELNEIVDSIGKLITDNFYLKRAQAFHYGKYEYY